MSDAKIDQADEAAHSADAEKPAPAPDDDGEKGPAPPKPETEAPTEEPLPLAAEQGGGPQPDTEMPTHDRLRGDVALMAERFGAGAVTRLHAAVLEFIGVPDEDAQRLARVLTAPKNPDEALQRCGDIIDNMHGSDEMRRQVVAGLRERYNA